MYVEEDWQRLQSKQSTQILCSCESCDNPTIEFRVASNHCAGAIYAATYHMRAFCLARPNMSVYEEDHHGCMPL
jgi:hypothetical protein